MNKLSDVDFVLQIFLRDILHVYFEWFVIASVQLV